LHTLGDGVAGTSSVSVRIEIGAITKGRESNELVSFEFLDFLYTLAGFLLKSFPFEVPFFTSARGSGEMHMQISIHQFEKKIGERVSRCCFMLSNEFKHTARR
jgi:hypothetical protein